MQNDLEKKSIGSKAFNLYILKEKGFNIPEFSIITPEMNTEDIKNYILSCSKNKLYAIRSSSHDEDEKNNSSAGQFETFVRVAKNDILKYILEVRNNNNIPVIVQEWIEADYSGIAFSRDPLGEYFLPIIEYTKGTAEENVAGMITPKKIIGTKKNLKKSKKFIKKIFNSLVDVENIFGFPVDIEWVYKDSSLYLIQVRPITSFKGFDYDLFKNIDELIGDKSNYIYERADICGGISRATNFNIDLISYIFDSSKIFESVYKKKGINYLSKNCYYPVGSYLYINRQEELHQTTPSYYYKTRDLKKIGISNLFEIPKTLKNISELAQFSRFDSYPEDLKKNVTFLLQKEININDIKTLKYTVSSFYEKIIIMGIYVMLNEKKKIKILSSSGPISSINFSSYTGNTFSLFDKSSFLFTDFSSNKEDSLGNFREYSRWLSVKLMSSIRRYLHKVAVENNIKNKELMFHVTFDELEKNFINESELMSRYLLFKEGLKSNYPLIISDLPNGSNTNGIAVLSPGNFEGILSSEVSEDYDVVLYTEFITPDLVDKFSNVRAIITQYGGALSHLAILAREKGIPVIQTNIKLKEGSRVVWKKDNGLNIF